MKPFDQVIGELDNNLSELMLRVTKYKSDLTEAQEQTLKHHAEDMILCAVAVMLKINLPTEKINNFLKDQLK